MSCCGKYCDEDSSNKKIVPTNYLVPNGTTHLMTWVVGPLPTERIVHYQQDCGSGKDKAYEYENKNKRSIGQTVVNYVALLKGECKKRKQKANLVY